MLEEARTWAKEIFYVGCDNPNTVKVQFHHRPDCHIVYLDGPPAYNKTGPVFGAAWNLPIKDARPMAQVIEHGVPKKK